MRLIRLLEYYGRIDEKDLPDLKQGSVTVSVSNVVQTQMKKSFMMKLHTDGHDIGRFEYRNFDGVIDGNHAESFAEIPLSWANQGYGKLMILAAMQVAEHYGMIYFSSLQLSKQQQSAYHWLERQGYIVSEMHSVFHPERARWTLTDSGKQYLNKFVVKINY